MNRVIIAGGRDYDDYDGLVDAMSTFFNFDWEYEPPIEIVSGVAQGADRLGERFAKDFDIKVHKFPADWDQYGKGAGFIRNREMGDFADTLIAFWDGKSKGTQNMINTMQKLKKPYVVVPYAET